MELRLPSLTQLRQIYETDMKEAFPPAELKPLSAMERMWQEEKYKPWCLFDGDQPVGLAFLWLGDDPAGRCWIIFVFRLSGETTVWAARSCGC